MFVHNLDPVLFSIGSLDVRWYGIVYVLGFLAAYWAFRKLGGLTPKEADGLTLWLVVGLLLGSRVFFFTFYRPDLFSPAEFFALWNGGMSFHGALAGLLVAGLLWSKRHGIDFWRLADVGALVAAFFLSLGRMANFINAEIVGVRSDDPWCVVFPGVDGCRHPVQIYSAIKDLIIGGLLVLLWTSRRRFTPGFIFWCFAALYGILRFIVNFWRDDPVLAFGWLKMGHVLSVALLLVAGAVILTRHRQDTTKLFKS